MNKKTEDGIAVALFFFLFGTIPIAAALLGEYATHKQDVRAFLQNPSVGQAFDALWVYALFPAAFTLIGIAFFVYIVLFGPDQNGNNYKPDHAG